MLAIKETEREKRCDDLPSPETIRRMGEIQLLNNHGDIFEQNRKIIHAATHHANGVHKTFIFGCYSPLALSFCYSTLDCSLEQDSLS